MKAKLEYGGHEALLEAWARADDRLVLASIVGTRESVRAIHAALNGDRWAFLQPKGRLVRMPGARAIFEALPGASHAILYDPQTDPRFGRYLIGRSAKEVRDLLFLAIEHRTPLPLHRDWTPLLWTWAEERGYLEPLETSPGLVGYEVDAALYGAEGVNDLKATLEEHFEEAARAA